MSRWPVIVSLMAFAAAASVPLAAEGWQPIAPGAADRMVETTDPCPTFSWSAPAAGSRSQGSVSVVVVNVTNGGRGVTAGEQDVVLAARLPAGARSWTPSSEQCLERGRSYRWFVLQGEGRILASEGHAFAISHLPSDAAITWARDVLHRHLGASAPAPPTRVAQVPGPPASPAQVAPEGHSNAPVESTFSGDATVGINGATHVVGVRAVKIGSSSGDVVAEGSIISQQSPILGNGITFTDSSGNSQIVVSQPDANFDLEIHGGFIAGSLDATTSVRATAVQVSSGTYTGDDGGTGVEDVDQKDCGFLGFADCIRVDENDTFCTGGSFVVAARLWQTDGDQIGVQVKCTDPLPLSNP